MVGRKGAADAPLTSRRRIVFSTDYGIRPSVHTSLLVEFLLPSVLLTVSVPPALRLAQQYSTSSRSTVLFADQGQHI